MDIGRNAQLDYSLQPGAENILHIDPRSGVITGNSKELEQKRFKEILFLKRLY